MVYEYVEGRAGGDKNFVNILSVELFSTLLLARYLADPEIFNNPAANDPDIEASKLSISFISSMDISFPKLREDSGCQRTHFPLSISSGAHKENPGMNWLE